LWFDPLRESECKEKNYSCRFQTAIGNITKLGADLPRNGLRELQANLFSAQLLAKQEHQLRHCRLGSHIRSTHHPYS
jgi:hypothetical protein